MALRVGVLPHADLPHLVPCFRICRELLRLGHDVAVFGSDVQRIGRAHSEAWGDLLEAFHLEGRQLVHRTRDENLSGWLARMATERGLDMLILDAVWQGLAFALAVCMLSLLGFPGTAGFIGKWYILIAATSTSQNVLAAILVLTSVVSAGYYLPVIMAMYMKAEPDEAAHVDVCLDRWGRTAVAAVVIALLLFGVWPNRLFDLAKAAGESVQPTATTAVTPH